MKYNIYFWLAAFTLLTFSCTKEIDLEHLRPESRLVLNSLITAGDSVKVRLTRTWFYTEISPDVTVRNADIKLYVNGVFKEKMVWKAYEKATNSYNDIFDDNVKIKGYYISSYRPVKGDSIKITVEANGFEGISAETHLPVHTYLKDFKAKESEREDNGFTYKSTDFEVTIKDDPDKKDFYLIDFEQGYPESVFVDENMHEMEYTGKYLWMGYSPDYSTEPLFTSHLSALDKILGYDWISGEYGRAFSDDLINGKEYTIKLKSDNYSYMTSPNPDSAPPLYYRVNLYTITEEYYRYIKAIIEIKDGGGLDSHLSDVGLAEPVRIFSNVKGGVGILGSAVRDSVTVSISPLF